MLQKKRLTLMVPDLFAHIKHSASKQDFAHLSRALSKAKLNTHSAPSDNIAHLATISGLEAFDAQAKAALYLNGCGRPLEAWGCYVSPVLMQPNRDHLSIIQSSGFNFSENELKSLCAEFNDYFKEDGFQFRFLTPEIWICFSENNPAVSTVSPHDILGENIIASLPSRGSDMQWRKLFNETQMLLHHSSANKDRILNGKIEINSLWFWGGGSLPAAYQSSMEVIYSNNFEVLGFAKLGGVKTHTLPVDVSKNLSSVYSEQLIYIDLDHDQIQEREAYSLIEQYLESFSKLLKDQLLDELIIIPDAKQSFILTGGGLKKFWRSHKPITAFLPG